MKSKELYDWIYKEYEISFLPKVFFVNMNNVFKGTYKNLKKPVPIEDLYDMWQRMLPKLKKINERNRQIGKNIEGHSLIMYDLAIILSKYDSYLEWKKSWNENKVDYQKEYQTIFFCNKDKSITEKQKSKSEIDINSILDDI